MKHDEIVKAIQHIYPEGAVFSLRDNELEWLDENKAKPTEVEIQQAWSDYQVKIETEKVESLSKKQALLDKLGITEEEAKLLLS
jgi:hypothetical protein